MNGLVLVNKQSGYTSRDVDNILRSMIHEKKIGHMGTLDPNATGLLVCLLGNATKYQDFFKEDKVYEAELILGISTDTDDITGEVRKSVDFISVDEDFELEEALNKFIGVQLQIPPMYSAKHHDGKRLYEFARDGIVVDRIPQTIQIYSIEIIKDLDFVRSNDYLSCMLRIHCSKGTYIRALCRDIGKLLSVPACMGDLKRISIDDFKLEDANTLMEIDEMISDRDFSFVRPCFYLNEPSVVTFGKFEAFHLGHQKIFHNMLDIASKNNLQTAAIIFGMNEYDQLYSLDDRYNYLHNFGVDNIFRVPFGEEIKNISAKEFIDEILIKQMKAKYIVVGSDCSFGKNKKGDANFLKEYAESKGVNVSIIEKEKIMIEDKEFEISSSLIKKYLVENKIDLVEKMLNRKYQISN